MELVPFQTKRKKVFKNEITAEEAIQNELLAYWKKTFPLLFQHLKDNPHLIDTINTLLVPILSPQYVKDETLPWTLLRLQNPLEALLTLQEIANATKETYPKKVIEGLPRTYQKILKRIYTSQITLDALAHEIQSNKRAQKTLRILHKRLGIYTKKKPPFKKVLKIG